MIISDREYKRSLKLIKDQIEQIRKLNASLEKEAGLTKEAVDRVSSPLVSFSEQIKSEVSIYEDLKGGEVGKIDMTNIGVALVQLRIASGLTQTEFARKLKVHPTQVHRDEKNEYHGSSLERVIKVLSALSVGGSLFRLAIRKV